MRTLRRRVFPGGKLGATVSAGTGMFRTDISRICGRCCNAGRYSPQPDRRGIRRARAGLPTGNVTSVPSLRSAGPRMKKYEFMPDVVVPAGEYELRIARPVLKEMKAWIAQNRRVRSRDVETGGLIWGEWDDAGPFSVRVTDASGPPPDSRHSAELFLCGRETVSPRKQRAHQVHTAPPFNTSGCGTLIRCPDRCRAEIDINGMAEILTAGPVPPRKNLLLIQWVVTPETMFWEHLLLFGEAATMQYSHA